MGYIKQHIIDAVFDAARVEDVVGKHLQLKKAGINFSASCPFHNEKSNSFIVSPVKNLFKCFGCGVGGNSVTFLMRHKNLNYPEAIKTVAEIYGIEIEYEEDDQENQKDRDDRELLYRCNQVAAEKYHSILMALDESHAAKQFLYQRGINKQMIVEWCLGYAPNAWDSITIFLQQNDFHQQALDLGLIKKREKSEGHFDYFRNRIIIPIEDKHSRIVGFGGRAIDPEDVKKAKFLNSQESPIYNKSKTLFGYNKALTTIRQQKTAFNIEGYFDIIQMHAAGIINSVASCGTSVTEDQLNEIKRNANEICMVMDGDNAGFNSLKRTLPIALKTDLKVTMVPMPAGMDPDDFCRKTQNAFDEMHKMKVDALLWLAAELMKLCGDDPHRKSESIEELARIINDIPKPTIKEWYLQHLKDAGIKHKEVRDAIKSIEAVERKKMIQLGYRSPDENYELPREVLKTDGSFEKYQEDILKYGLFMHRNRIYVLRGETRGAKSGKEKYFIKISNFSCEIIQHMEDEKFPMKLVKICNEHGKFRTFDTPSKSFISLNAFNEMVTNYGNYQFSGSAGDFDLVKSKMMDEMGDGRMINVLGQQHEGFWCFSNAVIISDEVIQLDEYGCFDYQGSSYYIPSGNIIYKHNNTKFSNEKRAIFQQSNISLKEYLARIKQVHGQHAMNGILFTIATMFSDIIFERIGFFPILFLYGEASTGKDNLIEACQAFFGKPQEALLLTSKANTDKARIRVLAQFRNLIANFREYKVDEVVDEMLKGVWDRSGYKRGNIDSAYGTDTIPIECGVMVSSNDYPVNDALITRIISEEFMKTEFTETEKKNYNELKELILSGVSSLITEILPLRSEIKQHFRRVFNEVSNELKSSLNNLMVADRMIQNVAVLGAMYKLTESKVQFPFSFADWLKHSEKVMANQARKRETGSVIQRFWDCFLAAVKEKNDPLINEREFKISGEKLFINLNQVYPSYQRQHFLMFRENGMAKTILMDKLKKSTGFNDIKSSVRFNESKTSGYEFDLNKLHIAADLLDVIGWKEKERTKYNGWQSNDEPKTEKNESAQIPLDVPF